MLEKIGNKDVYVRNYTSNFNVKEFIQNILLVKAFPTIEINKLNLGFVGIVSEMISQAIEDSFGTAALMMNEAFINRAILPNSIYSIAALFDLGYTFATPSRARFALQLWLDDIIKYSTKVGTTNTFRYILDKDTKLVLENNTYLLDYDVIIDHQFINGNRAFNIYYNIDDNNSISIVKDKYIKHQISSIGWIALFVELQECGRKVTESIISDNLITNNSDITLKWTNQIAGIDLKYITPYGETLNMQLKTIYTAEEQEPFCWYKFVDDNTIKLSFSANRLYFQPAFNSKIQATIHTTKGLSANFDHYDNKTAVPIQKTGNRYEYNSSTKMVGLCYSGSIGGLDKANIELLRDDIIMAFNTANVLTTDYDLKLWFERNAKRYGTVSEFFKRRDDPTGRLFSQFVAITDNTYIYPTNTLTIDVDQNQFDYVNSDEDGVNKEFIILPGHLWEYADEVDGNGYPILVRDRLRMVNGLNGVAKITDETLPALNNNRKFMFVNPFLIKIFRNPTISACYNYLISDTSWPEAIEIQTSSFYQFQIATLSIDRSLSKKGNKYKIQLIAVPVVTLSQHLKYIEGISTNPNEFPVEENNLRVVIITRSNVYGETGYIELKPVELRNAGAVLFETEIEIFDNLLSDMTLEIDQDKTPGIHSLITSGPNQGKVFLDASETSIHIITLMKDNENISTDLFNNPTYHGYLMTNRFANSNRDLNLYTPMTMMRSVITFAGQNDGYRIRASLIPFLKYDIPLDDEKMSYFIRAFNEQYRTMEPVLSKLDGNSFIDFKLFNTYGRSNNYYIGPIDNSDILWDSDILLDDLDVRIKLRIAVNDRSLFTQTVEGVINKITSFFEDLNIGKIKNVHVSDLIYQIKSNQSNISYIRFVGFNDYDSNKQSLFVKYDDISDLKKDQLQPFVPEMLRINKENINILEEV